MTVCFVLNATATTGIYTLSLHDALPISEPGVNKTQLKKFKQLLTEKREEIVRKAKQTLEDDMALDRSEEHTSELQSHVNLVCRLLLEKKNDSAPVCDFYTRMLRAVSLHL